MTHTATNVHPFGERFWRVLQSPLDAVTSLEAREVMSRLQLLDRRTFAAIQVEVVVMPG